MDASNVAARPMATLTGSPDCALDNRALLRFSRGRALTSDLSSVAGLDEAAAGEPATAIREKAERSPHGVGVGEELLDERGGPRVVPHAVRPHPPRGAVDKHDQVNGTRPWTPRKGRPGRCAPSP